MQRRVGHAPLDPQVREVLLDRPVEVTRGRAPPQTSASASRPPRHASARSSSSRADSSDASPPSGPPIICGELALPLRAVEADDLGHGPALALALRDPVVRVGVGGDLGQVGHAQDLVLAGERPQAAPDRVRAPPADAGVDLVEHERRRGVDLGEDLLDRERDPRQLAARGDPRERPGRLAGVRAELEHDGVDARARRTRPRRRRPRPRGRRGRPGAARAPPRTRPPESRAPRAPPTPRRRARPRSPRPEQRQRRRGVRDREQQARVLGGAARPLVLEAAQARRPRPRSARRAR